MKRTYYIPLVSVLLMSCYNNLEFETLTTEKIVCDLNNHIIDNYVTIDAVNSFVTNDIRTVKSGVSGFKVTPYTSSDGDTLMYLVNYEDSKGWKIISSDSRTPAILAESEIGCFSVDDNTHGIQAWIDIVSNNIKRIRHLPDSALSFSPLDIALNRSTWTGERVVRRGPGNGYGYWEEIVSSEIEDYVIQDHFVAKWHQHEPYNQYCPLKTDGSGDRTPAGCVAVAGSEVLYYLHNQIGKPRFMYTNVSYTADSIIFSNPDSTIWASMNPQCQFISYSNLPEAVMIRYVGAASATDYHNSFSWALPMALRVLVFNGLGITCFSGAYDESIVKESMNSMMPVIVTASDQMIPVNGRIHCFVIDGFRMVRTKYTIYHHWDQNPESPNPHILPDYYSYEYSPPFIYQIKINWGWESQWLIPPVNDGWYSLTAHWEVQNGETYNYNNNVSMIYGFSTE